MKLKTSHIVGLALVVDALLLVCVDVSTSHDRRKLNLCEALLVGAGVSVAAMRSEAGSQSDTPE